MKMTWEDGDGIQRGFDSPIVIRRRLMTMSTTDGAARIIRDATSDDVDDFLAENDVKLVPENATVVEPEEYARMKDLARMYADQVERANREAARANYAEFLLGLALDEGLKAASDAKQSSTPSQDDIEAAKLEGYDACEKVYREREEAWEAERAELVEDLRVTQEKLSELRKRARAYDIVRICVEGLHDLEIHWAGRTIDGTLHKVSVDPAPSRVVKSTEVFDAIEEMLQEVRRG